MMAYKKDLVMQLTVFVILGFIISMIIFEGNTKSPLQIDDQPQPLSQSLWVNNN